MELEGRHDTFEVLCRCEGVVKRNPPQTDFETCRAVCEECGGEASVSDDAGVVKVYPVDGSRIFARVK